MQDFEIDATFARVIGAEAKAQESCCGLSEYIPRIKLQTLRNHKLYNFQQ